MYNVTKTSELKILHQWHPSLPYVTGVDIICNKVYNIAYGHVVYVGQYNGRYVVNVKSNFNEIIRYCNLTYVNVNTTQYIEQGQLVGQSDDYVHIEYCTSWEGNSIFSVIVNKLTYYKQDPSDIIEGKYTVVPVVSLDYGSTNMLSSVDYTEYQSKEFSGGKW